MDGGNSSAFSNGRSVAQRLSRSMPQLNGNASLSPNIGNNRNVLRNSSFIQNRPASLNRDIRSFSPSRSSSIMSRAESFNDMMPTPDTQRYGKDYKIGTGNIYNKDVEAIEQKCATIRNRMQDLNLKYINAKLTGADKILEKRTKQAIDAKEKAAMYDTDEKMIDFFMDEKDGSLSPKMVFLTIITAGLAPAFAAIAYAIKKEHLENQANRLESILNNTTRRCDAQMKQTIDAVQKAERRDIANAVKTKEDKFYISQQDVPNDKLVDRVYGAIQTFREQTYEEQLVQASMAKDLELMYRGGEPVYLQSIIEANPTANLTELATRGLENVENTIAMQDQEYLRVMEEIERSSISSIKNDNRASVSSIESGYTSLPNSNESLDNHQFSNETKSLIEGFHKDDMTTLKSLQNSIQGSVISAENVNSGTIMPSNSLKNIPEKEKSI